MENKDKSAYPHSSAIYSEGFSKREYFAAMAMQGLLSNTTTMEAAVQGVLQGRIPALDKHVTGMAVEYADAFLKQLGE